MRDAVPLGDGVACFPLSLALRERRNPGFRLQSRGTLSNMPE